MISCLANLSFDIMGISGYNVTLGLKSSWKTGPHSLGTVRYKACNSFKGIIFQCAIYQSMPISFSVFMQFILTERGSSLQKPGIFQKKLNIIEKLLLFKLKTSIQIEVFQPGFLILKLQPYAVKAFVHFIVYLLWYSFFFCVCKFIVWTDLRVLQIFKSFIFLCSISQQNTIALNFILPL